MKKKKKISRKHMLMTICLTTVILIAVLLSIYFVISNEEYYKIEPRSENVLNYKTSNSNYEVNGWLRVQGTNIDYPVIYPDNDLDLSRVLGDFTWVLENEEELMDRTVILGHNIRNVSSNPLITDSNHTKFEQLLSFIYYDFAKDNQYIQYTRDGKDYIYQIFSVSFIETYNLPLSGDLSKSELKEYINESINNSYFKYDVKVDENDKIITLITCTRFFDDARYNFKIDGKLLGSDEKTKLKKVTVNSNYKEIEDIMRGEEENEKKA